MQTTALCPELTQYKKLASGQLSSPEKEAVLDHLEKCQACVQRVESLSEKDTLVNLIRQARTLGEGPTGETVARLVERLRKLRPSAEAQGQIRLVCSGCGKSLEVKGTHGSKEVQCPHCHAVIPLSETPEPQGEDPRRSAGLEGDETLGLAPTSSARDRCTAATQSYCGAGPTESASKALYDFLAPAQSPDELGRLGSYRVLKVLGAGGMGVVFQAEDPQLQRIVALKAMLPGLAASDSAKQRFLREARAAAALKHDHIVTIFQIGEDRGATFLAMEFLEGEALETRLKRESKLPLVEVLRIGREMAEGLAAAHKHGLIHRDIKPANIWLEGKTGRVKILDFGLARAATDEAHLTQSGAILGTPSYMAPEQAQGKTVDPRSDLFSLGCVLYRMATGEAPFRGTDVISTLMAVATELPRPPRHLEPALPPALSELILRLLEKAPGDRPVSAQAVAEELQRLSHEPSTTPCARREQVARGQEAKPTSRRKRKPLTALAVVAGLALGGWLLGGLIVKVKTPQGTIVVQVDQPDAQITVDDGKVTVNVPGDNKPVEIRVEPGQHKLRISKDGFVSVTQEIELQTGKAQPIKIRLEPAQSPLRPAATVTDAWLKEVAALPPAERVKAVATKLKELNPGFDGKVDYALDGEDVVNLSFSTPNVKDISPLRALPGLKKLACPGSWFARNGQVADLTPLRGMMLTSLHCLDTHVADLSPLQGMPLTNLDCGNTRVSKLSPLKGMPLANLNILQTQVEDLSPLTGMKLEELNCYNTPVTDLSPLQGMKLTWLSCFRTQVTGAGLAPLQEMTSLRHLEIGGPKMTEAGLAHLKKLTDLEYLYCAHMRLTGAGLVHIGGLKRLQILNLEATPVTDVDLVHLKGLLDLRELFLDQTRVTDAGLDHLAGLKNLAWLGLTGTAVTDKGIAKIKVALPKCTINTDLKAPVR